MRVLEHLRKFDPEESDNEDEVDSPSDELYGQTITEEGEQKRSDSEERLDKADELYETITEGGVQKQFDPEESDNKE